MREWTVSLPTVLEEQVLNIWPDYLVNTLLVLTQV